LKCHAIPSLFIWWNYFSVPVFRRQKSVRITKPKTQPSQRKNPLSLFNLARLLLASSSYHKNFLSLCSTTTMAKLLNWLVLLLVVISSTTLAMEDVLITDKTIVENGTNNEAMTATLMVEYENIEKNSETTRTAATTTTTLEEVADLVPSGVPKERIASEEEEEIMNDLADLVPGSAPDQKKMRKGVRNLQYVRPPFTAATGYGSGTIRAPGQPKAKQPKDNSGTTVFTKMNGDGSGGIPGGVQSTTGDNTGNYVTDRGYRTAGIPILQDTGCTGTDSIVATYPNYKHTISKCGIVEKKACTNPFDVSVDQKNDYRSNIACMDGTCGGCCRDYKYLECDRDGTFFPFVPCICSERTYGGNPFTRATGSGPAPVTPVARPPVAPPVARPTAPRNRVQTSQCKANRNERPWWNKGLGEKPRTTPANFPRGFRLGECTYSSHCAGTPGQCCMPDFCLCGSGPDCLV
jgi:hypothetical protein